MPLSTASFVITIWPNAITVPTERSMPAVRITSVCPIASTPTTITCWSTSERFWVWRKRSDFSEKKARQQEGGERLDSRRRSDATSELSARGRAVVGRA